MKNTDIERLIQPKKIAVIGASENTDKAGGIVFRNLLSSPARLYPVNPHYETVHHIPAVPAISGLPENIDIAVICLGAGAAVEAAEECAARGAAFIIILAGGFGETGEEGRRMEDRLRRIPRKYGARILGPNSLGVFVPDSRLDTIFVEHGDKALANGGNIAFVSQSGSVGVESLGLASNTGYSMRAFIGTGNKIDLNEDDFLQWFAADEKTGCIALYLESIEGGRSLLERIETISRRKPVVILKAGRTEAGASAAGSHTGRLAGSDNVINGAFSQYGVQRAWDDEELCDASKVLSRLKPARGNRVAVVTPAGGFGVMCADYIDTKGTRADLKMAKLSPETVERIRKSTFPFASCSNPVDFTASATEQMYADTIDALIADDGVDIIICIALFSPPAISDGLIELISARIADSPKPVLVFTEFGPFTDRYLHRFYESGVAGFPSISRVVRAARFLVERGQILERAKCRDNSEHCPENSLEEGTFQAWIKTLRCDGKPDEWEVKQLLRKCGLPVAAETRILPDEDFAATAGKLAFPAVIKVCSPEILHKTEHGGVVLNVSAENFASEAAELRRKFPGQPLLAAPMARFSGPEFILGAIPDPVFGPSVMAGAGGILTELFRDITFRLAPCSRLQAKEMLKELTIHPVLEGYRGSRMDLEALAGIIARFSEISAEVAGNGGQIDINPLVWTEKGWLILDAKIILKA